MPNKILPLLCSATLGLFVLAVANSVFAAPVASRWGKITQIRSGWAADSAAVFINVPIVNPSGCEVENDGYATNPADPGNRLYHTIALTALLNNREVFATVDGCVFKKPRLIGLAIR